MTDRRGGWTRKSAAGAAPSALPEVVNVLGKVYRVVYCADSADVNKGEDGMWGYVSHFDREIRVYAPPSHHQANAFEALLHEVVHVVEEELELKCFESVAGEDDLLRLSVGLADFLIRNGFVKLEV